MNKKESKKDFTILYIFLIIASIAIISIYLNENKIIISEQKTPTIKENELLKNPEGRIPEHILVDDIKMKYNYSTKIYEKEN